AAVVGLGVMGIIIAAIVAADDVLVNRGTGIAATTVEKPDENVRQLARSIFSDNVFAFELTSVLLLVAVVGTVLMARRIKTNGEGK
ncbi:MAG: NADH-ubiquinone/plastoquinone oxidoreductase chain 6, partial [Actinomycetota bacterium]